MFPDVSSVFVAHWKRQLTDNELEPTKCNLMGKSRANRRNNSPREAVLSSKNGVAEGILSPELVAELGGGNESTNSAGIGGPMAMTAKPKKGKKRGRAGAEKISEETRDLAARISKSKAKKLKQIEDKKAKDGRRAELYRKLEENRLSQDHMSLLQSSKTISQNQDTLKSRIKHAIQRAVAGIRIENAVIEELDAHPDVVADVEESLSLPVGGAMDAARKTQMSKSSSERVPTKAPGKTKALGRDGVMKRSSQSNGRDIGKGPSFVRAATRRGSSITTMSVSSRKPDRSSAPAVSNLVSVISVNREESSSDSSTDDENEGEKEDEKKAETDQIDGGDHGEAGGEEELGGMLKTVDNDTKILASGGRRKEASEDDAPSREKPENSTGNNDAPAETVGSSWAAKMMASLSQVTSTKKGSVESPSTLDGMSPSKADNEGDNDDSEEVGKDKETTAPTSYPPPPKWLQAKTPAYHAIETPLPSTAGDDGETIAAGSNFNPPRPKRWVPVKRSVELQAARMELPVCGMEQEIVEAIHDNDAVILCGETGSGKSTQVPQFLYEAGYAAHGLIGVTQPRRVAAVGTAERVAVELGTKCGRSGVVAYQIRYDASGVGEKTRVKFMTDGVLLREISSDLLLRKYSVVLLDEAHERNLNTDVLLGMLSRSIPLRKKIAEEEQRSWEMLSKESKKEAQLPLRPLKLVIMSATLRVTDFTENSALFPKPPPVITATSRQHPVTVHFNKRTELYDYLGETFKKVCKIHRRLPNGGILVFLTGKREILHMCDKLRREFPLPRARRQSGFGSRKRGGNFDKESLDDKDAGQNGTEDDGARGGGDELESEQRKHWEVKPNASREKPRETNKELLLYREADDDEEDAARLADMEEDLEGGVGEQNKGQTEEEGGIGDDEGALSSGSEVERGDDAGRVKEDEPALSPVHVVPLYAMLTAEEQAKVFRAPPEGHRLIVVATNVAETSITIPGIAYVVDCGRQKRKVVQHGSGISQFEVGWVSRASADQRAGRAGRTGPGHCYRLYSSAVYTQTFEAFAAPEVVTRPLEDVVLQMKAMGIVDVSRFPFPTSPDAAGLRSAISLLENLGATRAGRTGNGEITPVGKALALLPVGARYSKMLLLALQGGLLAHATAVVAMLTEGDPFLRQDSSVKGDTEEGGAIEEVDEEEIRRKRAQWMHPNSDALARLKAAGAYDHATAGGTVAGGSAFCRDNLLHVPTMERALQLRRQLLRLVNLRFGADKAWKDSATKGSLKPPGRRQTDALRQIVLSGLLDNVARRAPAGTVKAGTKLQRDCAYLSCNEAVVEPLYIKSASVLFSRDPGDLPEWVVYQSIVRGEREGAAANMTCLTAIEPSWLPALAEGSPMLTFSEPLTSPPPSYDATRNAVICRVVPRYGVHAWELPLHTMELASAAPANKPNLVFRWFGRLLLEGGVAGCLSELKERNMLNDPPSLITREMPTKKVSILLLELRQKGVCTLPDLVRRWCYNPTYLKSAVAIWLKVTCRKDFDAVWANAVRRAVLALEVKAVGEDK